MPLKSYLTTFVLVVIISSAAGAQGRVYLSPRPSMGAGFQAPTATDFGRTLTGGSALPLRAAPTFAERDSLPPTRRLCPMPIAAPDSARLERILQVTSDTTRHDPMPIVKPQCVNPLRR
jgi:hypothetical protein